MKQKDVPILTERVLEILPTTQANIWKTLLLSSQDCADLIEILLAKNLIKRNKIVIEGRKTFYLEKLFNKPKAYTPLINNGIFSPCTGCEIEECIPENCNRLVSWIVSPCQILEKC